jgi:hypothetical protein
VRSKLPLIAHLNFKHRHPTTSDGAAASHNFFPTVVTYCLSAFPYLPPYGPTGTCPLTAAS